MGLKDKLTARAHRKTVEVQVPVLDEKIVMREVAVGEWQHADDMARSKVKGPDGAEVDSYDQLRFAAEMIAASALYPDTSERIFATWQDVIDTLGNETFTLLAGEALKVSRLNLTPDAAQKEALGNSEATPGGDTSSP